MGRAPVTKLTILLAKWGEYCEALFEELAVAAPEELAKLVCDGTLPPARLTYAAEILGRVDDHKLVVDSLLPLLAHRDPYIREGAILGLAPHVSEEIADYLRTLVERDPSPAVRAVARDALLEKKG